MPKLIEVIDSLTNENVEEVKEQLLSEAKAIIEKNSQLYSRAKKAEGFEYNKEAKEWIKKEKPAEPQPQPTVEPSEPDYAKLAFLEQRGISEGEDQKIVFDEAKRLNLPLTDILSMEHIKTQLKTAKEQREAQAGVPSGRGGKSGKSQQDVDYWIQKGELPQDQELAAKVVKAKIKQQKEGNKFSDELYVG